MSSFSHGDTSLAFTLESLIHNEQIDILESEFDEFKKSRTHRHQRMFFRYFECISHDGYGSLIFHFDDAVLELSKEEKNDIENTLDELMTDSKFMDNIFSINTIENEIEEVTRDLIIKNKLFDVYLMNLIECGYKISTNELYSIFEDRLTHDEIDKSSVLYKLKYSDKWID